MSGLSVLKSIQDREAAKDSTYYNSVHRKVYMYLIDLGKDKQAQEVRQLLQSTNSDDYTSVKDLSPEVLQGIEKITGWPADQL